MKVETENGTYFQKNPHSHGSHAEPTIFKPSEYASSDPRERQKLAYEDARQHFDFYKELIKEGVYPTGTKVKLKRDRHADAYILEFWMPKVKILDDVRSKWEMVPFAGKKKVADLNQQRYLQERKIVDAAERRGYVMNFAEIDPYEHENYGKKLRPMQQPKYSDDLNRGNNWGVDKDGKVRYIDVHVLNTRLPFRGRKKNRWEIAYDKYLEQQEATSKTRLEARVSAFIGIGSLLSCLLFLSSNITGNAIANLSLKSSNWLGAILFIIGLIGAFAYFKTK